MIINPFSEPHLQLQFWKLEQRCWSTCEGVTKQERLLSGIRWKRREDTSSKCHTPVPPCRHFQTDRRRSDSILPSPPPLKAEYRRSHSDPRVPGLCLTHRTARRNKAASDRRSVMRLMRKSRPGSNRLLPCSVFSARISPKCFLVS